MSTKWEGTGIYVDSQEFALVKQMIESIRSAPLVRISIAGPTLPQIGKEILFAEIKKMAVKHGLPDRSELYGVDINTGQILK